jgi:hypothetical protein
MQRYEIRDLTRRNGETEKRRNGVNIFAYFIMKEVQRDNA